MPEKVDEQADICPEHGVLANEKHLVQVSSSPTPQSNARLPIIGHLNARLRVMISQSYHSVTTHSQV